MVAFRPRPDAPPGGARRRWLYALVLAWGAQAIVAQSLLLREAQVLMSGTELAWGAVLFAWLLGVALGAGVGGGLAERLPRRAMALAAVLILLSVAVGLDLWAFRGARDWLDVPAGELLPLGKVMLAAVLLVTPASAFVGLAFPLACCVDVGTTASGGRLSLSRVYALESLGSLIGGAVFTFWAVEHLHPIQIALLAGAVTIAAAVGWLASDWRRALRWTFAGATLAVVVGIALLAGERLHHRLVERRWNALAPGYELVAEADTKYQNLAVARRAGQYTLFCDGQVTASFPDPYTFAPRAHFWLCQHPRPEHVLVLGGGAEGLLAEILRHPVTHVDYVEPDPRQIGFLRPYLAAADRAVLRDPRVAVIHSDARFHVKRRSGTYDLVIARLPEPTSALRARFYTAEFVAELRRAMTDRAVVCLTAAAAPTELSAASREYLASIRATLGLHFPDVLIGWGDPAQVLAATGRGLITTSPAVLMQRFAERPIVDTWFDPIWFDGATDWLEPAKVARRAGDVDAASDVAVSTDLRPTIYLQRLALWEAMSRASIGAGGTPGGAMAWLRTVRLTHLGVVLWGAMVLTVVFVRLRQRGPAGWLAGAVALSMGTTGAVTMALSVVWLFAFQSLYGYVYQRIGWIVALFMAGLAVGCLLGGRGSAARARRGLIVVDALLALLTLAIPVVLPPLVALQAEAWSLALVEVCVSLMVLLTGLLGGAAFPLAGQLQLSVAGRTGPAVGRVVGLDHAGACLGALLSGVLLVPVFGLLATAGVLAVMKLGSILALLAAWRGVRPAPGR